jgi:hypothetical protein
LDIRWILGVIPQRLAQFFHSSINAVFKINEGIGGPELLLDIFPRYHLAGPVEECDENLEGSFLKPYLGAVATHFPTSKVHLELSDPETRGCRGWYLHGGARPAFRF